MERRVDTQQGTLRSLLEFRLRGLHRSLAADQAEAHEIVADGAAAGVFDRKDTAADAVRTGLADALEQRDMLAITLVEQALRRMDMGTYGECLQCGADIPLERLLVQPEALRCAGCQEIVEKVRSFVR